MASRKLFWQNSIRTTSFLVGLVVSACASAQPSLPDPEPRCVYDFSNVEAFVEDMVERFHLDGCSLQIKQNGRIVYDEYFGSYDATTIVPIASATKWISGVVVMSAVNDGVLSLDDTTNRWLGWEGEKGTISLRQLMSHTSGISPDEVPCLDDRDTTLEACAAEIYALDLVAPPGSEVNYGGNSMQVAGRMCEIASGMTWNELFQTHVKLPLRMPDTWYNSSTNPRIAGGVATDLDDYGRMLEMLTQGGTSGPFRILTAGSLDALLADQTHGALGNDLPPCADLWGFRGYGIGNWIRELDDTGQAVIFTSPGKFGFTPWIDTTRNVTGVFLVVSSNLVLCGPVDELRLLVAATIDAGCMPIALVEGDADGDVDIADAAAWLMCMNGPHGFFPQPLPAGCTFVPDGDGPIPPDTDADFDIDLQDFADLQNCFSSENQPADAFCAP